MFFLIFPIYLFSFDLEFTGNYAQPLFSLSKYVQSGYGFTFQVPFLIKDNYKVDLAISNEIFKSKYFDETKLELIKFSPTFQYFLAKTFTFNLSWDMILDLLSENIKDSENNFGKFFISLSSDINFEYFYTERLHFISKLGFSCTDQLYYLYFKAGVLVKL